MEHQRRILLFVLYLVPVGAVLQTQNSTRSSKFLPFPFQVLQIAPEVCNTTTSKDFGVCVPGRGCRKGTVIGTCAGGYGVCCKFEVTCGGAIIQNGTNFVNPAGGKDSEASRGCKLDIPKLPKTNVCQVKLDFIDLELKGPMFNATVGTVSGCEDEDHLEISGIATTTSKNHLCGKLSGQHVYVDFGGREKIRIKLFASDKIKWNILVTYIPCNSPMLAPSGCLQYYSGLSGEVRSFNYVDKGKHLQGQDIAICIRSEEGMKSIKWTSCSKMEKVDFQDCSAKDGIEDYLTILDGEVFPSPTPATAMKQDRYCDEDFNDAHFVTSYLRPFMLHFKTKDNSTKALVGKGAGFCLRWQQMD